jgi:shikimate 5-dehydrogenase
MLFVKSTAYGKASLFGKEIITMNMIVGYKNIDPGDREAHVYTPAKKPTMYFIGVTTENSSIMKVFPEWAAYLDLGDCQLKGMNFRPHDTPEAYREAVVFIKRDTFSLGALVTTHKIDLLMACKDMFDELDPYAQKMGEVSSISKKDGTLVGHAKDPISSALALDAFLPESYWEQTGAEIFLMGAGGSTIALTSYLMQEKHGANRPSTIIVSNRSTPRLTEIERIHKTFKSDVPVEYRHAPSPEDNDALMNKLVPYSLVVNATGLGKDAPGSPLTNGAIFPEHGIAWDFNYRGDLIFLAQARAQQENRQLQIEDGWVYFLHGWTQVIAEVFHIDIPTKGSVFEELSIIAAKFRS